MADEDTDLVGNVRIDGLEDSTQQLDKFGDDGANAFNKLAAAATKAAAVIGAAGTKVSTAFKAIGQAAQPGAIPQKQLDDLATSVKEFARESRKAVKDVVDFGARVAALGAAGTAAGAGILYFARSVSQQLNQATDASKANLDAQTRAVQEQLTATQASINYQSSLRQLNQQLVNGTLSYDDYTKALVTTRAQYQESQKTAAQLADAQEQARIETERLQKQAADTKAWDDMRNKLGGPLTSSLVQLGNLVEQIRVDLVQTFSPALASIIDVITTAFQQNSAAISKFASTTAASIQQIVQQNGPAIQQAITGILGILQTLISGFVQVAPVVLSVINGAVIPAFQAVVAYLDQMATAINNIFGTQINAAFLLGVVALLKFTNAFKALFGVLGVISTGVSLFQSLSAVLVSATQGATGLLAVFRLLMAIMGPWGLAIAAVTLALGLLATQVDWKAWGATAVAAVTSIQQAWTDFVAFIGTLPGTILGFFQAIWDGIVAGFTNAVALVQQKFQAILNYAKQYIQPVIDMLRTLAALMSSTATGGGSSGDSVPAFAGGGKVRGKGTSISDSVLAWLSNGEFVVKAKAVAKYGTGLLHAINSGRFDISRMAGFAAGGGVSISPRFSSPSDTGSGASSLRPFTLQIGDQTFPGLLAPETVADRLTQFAVTKSSRSGGRKPSWYGA